MKKRTLLLALLGLVLVAGALAGIKYLQIRALIDQGKKAQVPPEVVSSTKAEIKTWPKALSAVGTIEAVQGIVVSAEAPGKITHIAFEAGSRVQAGAVLAQQDVSVETAQLHAAEAAANLSRINYERAQKLVAQRVTPVANLNNAEAQFKQSQAQIETLRATIAKKTIRAPFSGRLGIRLINLGQVLREGEGIVSLQALDPIFALFSLPQQQLNLIKQGQAVRISAENLQGSSLEGKISAINPQVDAASRNIRVQATVRNPGELLRPGMFVTAEALLNQENQVLAIPATAVLNAPYSDSVFLIEAAQPTADPDAKEKHPQTSANAHAQSPGQALVVRQQFVRLGERRGDFVAVVEGLKAQDVIVSSGVFKLRNGQSIIIDNNLAPEFKETPQPGDS